MQQLRLFNTLTRRKEPFEPMPGRGKRVGIYTCGPTVYADAHIGNLRSYVFPDVLKKLLRRLGYDVTHVINITDVGHLTSNEDTGEDKMERAARSAGRSSWEIAAEYTAKFLRDLERLGIAPPDVLPRAAGEIPPELRVRVAAISPRYADDHGHIAEQIALIQRIEARGAAYRTEDGIYFDTAKLPDYGKLARIKVEGLQEGARVEMGGKRHKTDFALWKFSPLDVKRQMEWDSPWGRGFPGWHIECSAMAMKYLGETFDIHTGGSDHIPVHHTNEIAQSEMATGQPFVRYWLHGEFLVLGEDKRMGKSEGNMLTLESLIAQGFDPLDYRYLCLNTHYRKFLNFSQEAMQAARTALAGLRSLAEAALPHGMPFAEFQGLCQSAQGSSEPRNDIERAVIDALCDDLNTPKALGLLWTALQDVSSTPTNKLGAVVFADAVLSLGLSGGIVEAGGVAVASDAEAGRAMEIPSHVAALAEERWAARARKDFAESDRLRDALAAEGWVVRDRKDGYDLTPKAGS